ncbi:MAG TPA: macro domain-containing protein [Chthonomonadaceae bacterium]|nr:macro domain-containing protein [Chthonomonadaceae bacterium]
MIEHKTGDLLRADVEALVNTVNTVGIMGKGVALQFRQAFPDNYTAYRKACMHGEVQLGKMFVFSTGHLTNPRLIINFPTKRDWRNKSRLEDIEAGLLDLIAVVRREGISSIALPPLGCGSGGLKWEIVRPKIEDAFAALPKVHVLLYAPEGAPIADTMKVATKRPNMTIGRAALLSALERYALPGYRLSMLEIQKLAYFLQTTGEPLKLDFAKQQYGPYAETLNHVLQRMEGHFIRGYGDRSGKTSVRLMPDAVAEARQFLYDYPQTEERLERVARLIEGFETPYGLELLATVHWVAQENPFAAIEVKTAIQGVHAWNQHKRATFQPAHIQVAWKRLYDHGWL